MSTPKATGYVRTIRARDRPGVLRAHPHPDGRRLQRKLGPAWLKRSPRRTGYLTRKDG